MRNQKKFKMYLKSFGRSNTITGPKTHCT